MKPTSVSIKNLQLLFYPHPGIWEQLRQHCYINDRHLRKGTFFYTSKLKIGRQSFSNRLLVFTCVNFDWICEITNDSIRIIESLSEWNSMTIADHKIGKQSLQNRCGEVINKLGFDWIDGFSDDGLRNRLKKHFRFPTWGGGISTGLGHKCKD